MQSIPSRLRHLQVPIKGLACALAVLLCACSTTPQGRMQLTAPAPVGDLYSRADMQLQLATMAGSTAQCTGVECEANREFDGRVRHLGERLAAAAFEIYPNLNKRIRHFEFKVEEKADYGSASDGSGKVIVFRGTQKAEPDDAELAFLLAREMGHVIGRHHDENSATRILFSVAAGVLFPALHLFNGTAVLAQATSATATTTTAATVATAAASTTTSYLGSKLVLASIKPNQLSEADVIALNLLERGGWSLHQVAAGLADRAQAGTGSAWGKDFLLSVNRIRMLDEDAEATASNLAAESAALQAAQAELQQNPVVAEKVSEPVAQVSEAEASDSRLKVGEADAAPLPAQAQVIPPEPAIQTIAVAESAAGGWEPMRTKPLPVLRSAALSKNLSSLSMSKLKHAAKPRLGKRKPAVKVALAKDRIKSRSKGAQALRALPVKTERRPLRLFGSRQAS